MKSENNGKIAIAIVAMFVVALSVVGFTYAYFTAQIKGNTAAKSVEVTAGRLQVTYASSRQMIAQNIVPGWTSDNKHYYDPVYSKYDPTTENGTTTYKIKAVSTDDSITCNVSGVSTASQSVSACDGAVASPSESNGKVAPAEFTVTNNSQKNTGDTLYAITLTDVVNGVVDKENLYVSLYNVTEENQVETETLLWSGNLIDPSSTAYTESSYASAGTNRQVILASPQGIDYGDPAKKYRVYLTYQNVTNGSQDASKNKTVSFVVEVIGVATNDGGSTYYDEDGNQVVFPASSGAVVLSTTTTTTVSAG